MSKVRILDAARTAVKSGRIQDVVSEFRRYHDDESGGGLEARKSSYATMVNHYYDLATDFYEYGWGQSFHFAVRHPGESFEESLRRHEYYLALQMGLPAGSRVLDVGCGVGGPMRAIARFAGYRIVGINNSEYQVQRAQSHNEREGLRDQCTVSKADFMEIPEPDGSFDGAFAIEATCHAPDRTKVFSEVYRVLRPGGVFTGYEWCLTAAYDGAQPEHARLKKQIEEGGAIPELTPIPVVDEALKRAGFVSVEARDLAADCTPETAWYRGLSGREWRLKSLPRKPWGRFLTHTAVRLLERLRIAPQGSTEVSEMLNRGADSLVRAGELGIFTPMYFFRAGKPH